MVLSMFVALAMLSAPVPAQERREAVYRVEFHIQDGADAKNTRSYSLLVSNNDKGSFRAGMKVPYATSPNQFNYAEVGVNLDARIQEHGGNVRLSTDLEMSTLAAEGRTVNPATPAIAALRVAVTTLLAPGKATRIAAIDDPVTKRKLDVEATVTRVD